MSVEGGAEFAEGGDNGDASAQELGKCRGNAGCSGQDQGGAPIIAKITVIVIGRAY